jgi:prolyl-tRNA synthetase
MKREQFVAEIGSLLDEIQNNLFERALAFQKQHTTVIDDKARFRAFFTPANKQQPEIHGGFALSGWCGSDDCEAAIKDDLGVTIRSIPFEGELEAADADRCIYCDKPSQATVVFAKAY